jgi:hypothetical protein
VRVLRNSRNEPWRRVTNCRGCHSKLEVVVSDLSYLSFVADSRDGDAYRFVCAVCQVENWLDAKLVPAGLVPR